MSVSIYHRPQLQTRTPNGGYAPGSIESRAAIEHVRRQNAGIPVEGYPPAPIEAAALTEPKPKTALPAIPKPLKPPARRTPRGPSTTNYVHYCDVCGDRFESKHPSAKHCSKSCDNRAYKLRRKAREAANPPTPKAPVVYTRSAIERERRFNEARNQAKEAA